MNERGHWGLLGGSGSDRKGRDVARQAAREAAEEQGVSLSDYLSNLLREEQEAAARANADPADLNDALNRITRKIEAVEARSTLAITGIEQSVVGLAARMERGENNTASMAAHVDGLVEDLRATHEQLKDKVAALEADDSHDQTLSALRGLEDALGKLATHVYEENALTQEETQAIKGRIEAGLGDLHERVGVMETRVETTLSEAARKVGQAVEHAELRSEGVTRQLSERLSGLEGKVEARLADAGSVEVRLASVEEDVHGALGSMEATLLRIQERLNRAENTTDTALQHLEASFAGLDQRIEMLAAEAGPAAAETLRREFEERFDSLASDLRASVAMARQDLASQIEKAAISVDPEMVRSFETSLDDIRARLAAAEAQQVRAIEKVGDEVQRISSGFDERLAHVEARNDTAASETVREEVSRLAETFEHRLDEIEQREASAIERVGAEMGKLADQLEERVIRSEEASALAIEQVGEQVAVAASRLQVRQDDTFRALAEKLDADRRRQEARLSDIIGTVTERIERIHSDAKGQLSPVQKAIASLAARIEAVEQFNAPPFTAVSPAPANPAQAFEPVDTGREDAPFADAFAPPPATPEIASAGEDAASEAIADAFEPGLPAFEGAADGDYVRAREAPRADAPEADEWDDPLEAHPDPFSELDLPGPDTDPLADLADEWDDGRSEARDSDVFDDETAPAPEPPAAAAPPVDPPVIATNREDRRQAARTMEESEAADYLARARRAAIEASRSSEGAREASIPSRRMKLYAAASVIAVAAAGSAAWLHLRGKQDPVSPGRVTLEQAASNEAVQQMASLIAEEADTGAGADETLFETGAAPLDEVDLAASESDLATHYPVPKIKPAAPTGAEAPAAAPARDFAAIPAISTIEDAADKGDRIAQYLIGQARIDAQDHAGAAGLIRASAEAGLPIAQYRLAKMHEKGLGMPRDLQAARVWTEKAARGGNVKAMHDLAVFMAEGEGGPQNYVNAVEWFAEAARHGVIDSQFNLAILYQEGIGVSPNLAEALFWFEVAARQGDPAAPDKVQELRGLVSAEAAEVARSRAMNWQAARADSIANGRFGAQPWNTGSEARIRAVQTALNALGYSAGPPDGQLGPSTAAAIRAYQADRGLAEGGTVTQGLVESLNEERQPEG